MPRGGRPTKRTPEARAAIIHALEGGCPLHVAAAAGGMHYDTLNEWRKADAEFSDAVQNAEGLAQQQLLQRIRIAAETGTTITKKDGEIIEYPGQWQAAAWLLERRWPTQYGKREHVEMRVDVTDAARKIAEESGLDPAEVLAEAERIVKAGS